MRLINNSGSERTIDLLKSTSSNAACLDLVTQDISLYAFKELLEELTRFSTARVIAPNDNQHYNLLGGDADRPYRNHLQNHWLAERLIQWLDKTAKFREAAGFVPQSMMVLSDESKTPVFGVLGAFAFTTDGLGITPGNPLGLIQATETEEEAAQLSAWFEQQWQMLPPVKVRDSALVHALREISADRAPYDINALILYNLFKDRDGSLDEDQVVKAATGIHQTKVWKKLYKFQKDAVIGAIDKLNRFGGCIIADSVGLGKTFEALAVIKYHELRNDRVLVLAPKRLRDNWTLYRANDRRNPLADDRFNYDVLNHTDLSRDQGMSGDIDLTHINWGNYDLVVIDESHNFRNKASYKDRESRYDRLMRRIIREGVKTRVLMLSATLTWPNSTGHLS